ncbi:DUF3833 family protein [Pseudoduganella eburnea]|uniref:DUF3833 family protein n=1 Tax=Massilia eburnea TaxID=1776165 RepID=A0A6L6QHQ4_9BURK|nr:DUF3833 domain-containing protein [Massilia eburnea]MTW11153.1 DUF3833 family protein [Massilia eburnea]
MKKFLNSLILLSLAGCAGQDVQMYAKEQPKLDVAEFFNGTTDAWGMFQRRNGEVLKRFKVEIEGKVGAGTLQLDEKFRNSDGSNDRRVWTLSRLPDGRWQGTAGDVKGQAHGEFAGNAFRWQYTLLLPVDGRTVEMQFDDWMYLIDACTMLNRASMRKFGIEFGQVTFMFRKRSCSP